jgi:hypothetical protein
LRCSLVVAREKLFASLALRERWVQTLLNPRFAVIEVLARDHILAAQEGPPHRALDAVINADFRFVNQVASRQSGHGRSSSRVLCEVAVV